MPDPNHEKLLAAALTLLERLPERSVAPNSAAIYLRVFQRMLEVGSGACQPLRPGMCRDTYGVARAALHYGARLQLGALATKLEGSVPGADPSETERAGEALIVAARRLWPVLAQHPPACGGDYNTQSPWSALQTAQPPFRGAGSKKRDLPRLADEAGDADRRDLVWAAASGKSGYHSATRHCRSVHSDPASTCLP